MINWRRKTVRRRLIKAILHPAITLGALLILFLLVFFGTLYQTDHGLHEAQEKFFGYGLVWVGGFFPLPGALSVLWALSLQLTVTIVLVLPLKMSKFGLWVSHLGVLSLMLGGFVTNLLAVESQLTLGEGETGHYTTSYHEWELAFWETVEDTNFVHAVDAEALRKGHTLELPSIRSRLHIRDYHRNSAAFSLQAAAGPSFISASGIGFLEARRPELEVTANTPGVIFTLSEDGKPNKEILLYGGEIQPLILTLDGRKIFIQLRLKHYPLDFSMKLTKFTKEVHPRTDIPSSFESQVQLMENGSSRAVEIWMNNPLRYQDYTFFQASYSQAPGGPQKSTFAVVTNPGRLLPYISSIVIFLGLLLHFVIRFLAFTRRENS